MTTEQKQIVEDLTKANITYNGFDKRFVNSLNVDAKHNPNCILSNKQIEWIFRLLYKYRKQCKALYNQHKTNPFCSKLVKAINLAQ